MGSLELTGARGAVNAARVFLLSPTLDIQKKTGLRLGEILVGQGLVNDPTCFILPLAGGLPLDVELVNSLPIPPSQGGRNE